ncbi:MAG TPA: hypothetical protein VMW75_01095 [Thermoanaerobaculia bacterium]|nr:hypothetical protein [Thermoanaerobaculia bacterium]
MDLTASALGSHLDSAPALTLRDRLNRQWHERALQIFMLIVLAHWAEHLAQAFQIYVLKWPIPQARGFLGLWQPWLVKSEVLHYTYALVMLIGLWLLWPGFTGRARTWWTVALVIQFWHHIEHALLQGQVIVGTNLFHSPVPTSILQQWIPRVELHLFYNTIVFIPMLVAMYYHKFPPAAEAAVMRCTCAVHSRPLIAA